MSEDSGTDSKVTQAGGGGKRKIEENRDEIDYIKKLREEDNNGDSVITNENDQYFQLIVHGKGGKY